MITRLTAHKGIGLVTGAIGDIIKSDIQFVLLGTGDLGYENFFQNLASGYPDKASAVIGFDKALSKRIYAAADLFLMPSRSEPCGLAQMIASRYGAVPIVRETGGLYDSIKNYNAVTGEGNGFTFTDFNAQNMLDTIWRAVSLYLRDKQQWGALVRKNYEYGFFMERFRRRIYEIIS